MAEDIGGKMKGIAIVELADGTICEAEIHWYEAHGIGRKDFKIKEGDTMSEFVICINNDSNPASLIVGKVYRRLPDPEAESHNMLRIVDEDLSELDGYLYPASMFVPVELPEEAKRVLRAMGS